jgi:hypothetical protein
MTYILNADPPVIRTKPRLIICEGFGDVGFINALLEHRQISNCNVGCPTKRTSTSEGKEGIREYLGAFVGVKTAPILEAVALVIDSDTNPNGAFNSMNEAWEFAELEGPTQPFVVEQKTVVVAVFVMPGNGKIGTLEHLLLDAVFGRTPKTKQCLDDFAACVGGIDLWAANKQAKMRFSALIAATCKTNPYCSPAWIWGQSGNPVPIDGAEFSELADFLTTFSTY